MDEDLIEVFKKLSEIIHLLQEWIEETELKIDKIENRIRQLELSKKL